jgi:Fic family protein
MHSMSRDFLDKLRFSASDLGSLQALAEFRGKQELFARQSPQALESLRRVAMVESAESSNRLEGITAPRDRILALVQETTAPRNRSEQEIAGYRDVLNLIHGNHASVDFSVEIIQQFHAQMMQYTGTPGGRWKERDNVIIERHADGSRRVRFRPTPARETPVAVAQLVENYNDAVHRDGRAPLVVIPLVILDFLCIHPFDDGNGRSSRLLTLLLLYHHGYEAGRYISLERIFEHTQESYYATLQRCSQGWHEGAHDVLPWMKYFWGVIIAAYREYEQRVGTIRTGRGAKGDQVRQAVERKLGSFRAADIEAECPGVSHEWVRRVLREMRDDGLIEFRGHGPGARWVKMRSDKRDG